jgi:hypothetical protein
MTLFSNQFKKHADHVNCRIQNKKSYEGVKAPFNAVFHFILRRNISAVRIEHAIIKDAVIGHTTFFTASSLQATCFVCTEHSPAGRPPVSENVNRK